MDTSDKILLIACGALSHEILELVRRNAWDHLDLTCLPAKYHHTPGRIPDAMRDKIRAHRGSYKNIYAMYGDCGTGGRLDQVLKEEGVERIAGPHCFSFFAGNDEYARWGENDITTFYLTDFFCRHFEKFVWEALALDRREDMVEFVFGNYEKVVYIAQTEEPELQQKAREIASRLKLDYEYRFVGYGDMASAMAALPVVMGSARVNGPDQSH